MQVPESENEKGPGKFERSAVFLIGIAVSALITFYLLNIQTQQQSWIPFLQTSATVSSLLVSFGGLTFVNSSKSINDFRADVWESRKPILDQFVTTNEIKFSQDRRIVKKDLESGLAINQAMNEFEKSMKSGLFNLLILWGISVILSLTLLLNPNLPFPVERVLFWGATVFLATEGLVFYLFLRQSTFILTQDYWSRLYEELAKSVVNRFNKSNNNANTNHESA